MKIDEIKQRIETSFGEGTEARVQGMDGTTDHVQAVVISPKFEGISMVDQHRMVMDLFKSEIASNELHAFTFRTFTPEQWKSQLQQISISRGS